ncbi:novel immune-type receptor 10a isoform X1 [Chanodichthys erythropterus]|uniref:novel immune-type receptor 10a isoform X1 n=1 Tax=Chanodichthys erythropterus TaxID=933992 RepID=UPI00351EE8B5
MLRISAASLLLLGMGFLQVTFSTASTQAHPGQSVTMWCEHDIHVSGDLYWFKQTDGDVPITIVRMLYTESLQKVEPKYFNGFTKQHLVMDLFSKSTTLTIKYANISDSGFYFCGATGYRMKFGNGTRLEVKEKNVISEKNDTRISKKDDDKSPVSSTKECSRDIFFTLTLLFGCIIVFACIIPLIMAIIKEHKRQKIKKVVVAECQTQQHDDKENDSVEYAAVHFKNKRPKTAGRHAEYSTAMYTDTT